MEKGLTFIDNGNEKFKAVKNEKEYWNGWAMPFIHHSEIERMIKHHSDDELTIKLENEKVIIIDNCYDETDIIEIEPTIFDGEKYFDFGKLGWCWEFEQETDHEFETKKVKITYKGETKAKETTVDVLRRKFEIKGESKQWIDNFFYTLKTRHQAFGTFAQYDLI